MGATLLGFKSSKYMHASRKRWKKFKRTVVVKLKSANSAYSTILVSLKAVNIIAMILREHVAITTMAKDEVMLST